MIITRVKSVVAAAFAGAALSVSLAQPSHAEGWFDSFSEWGYNQVLQPMFRKSPTPAGYQYPQQYPQNYRQQYPQQYPQQPDQSLPMTPSSDGFYRSVIGVRG